MGCRYSAPITPHSKEFELKDPSIENTLTKTYTKTSIKTYTKSTTNLSYNSNSTKGSSECFTNLIITTNSDIIIKAIHILLKYKNLIKYVRENEKINKMDYEREKELVREWLIISDKIDITYYHDKIHKYKIEYDYYLNKFNTLYIINENKELSDSTDPS
jgi:hypothetical protein